MKNIMDRITVFWTEIESPLDKVFIGWTEKGVLEVEFLNGRTPEGILMNLREEGFAVFNVMSGSIAEQLVEYFKGTRKKFHCKIEMHGTSFQRRIWKELLKIPYGSTMSYKEIAERVTNAKAARAAGKAIGANRIPIFIPCHRVIGNTGKLVGYRGGLEKKRWLLAHEARNMRKSLY